MFNRPISVINLIRLRQNADRNKYCCRRRSRGWGGHRLALVSKRP